MEQQFNNDLYSLAASINVISDEINHDAFLEHGRNAHLFPRNYHRGKVGKLQCERTIHVCLKIVDSLASKVDEVNDITLLRQFSQLQYKVLKLTLVLSS